MGACHAFPSAPPRVPSRWGPALYLHHLLLWHCWARTRVLYASAGAVYAQHARKCHTIYLKPASPVSISTFDSSFVLKSYFNDRFRLSLLAPQAVLHKSVWSGIRPSVQPSTYSFCGIGPIGVCQFFPRCLPALHALVDRLLPCLCLCLRLCLCLCLYLRLWIASCLTVAGLPDHPLATPRKTCT